MAGSFLGEGLTDLSGIFSGGSKRPPQQPGMPEQDNVPTYDFGTEYSVDPASGLPIVPGSEFGPPKPVSPSDKYGVPVTLEEVNGPVSAVLGWFKNLGHGVYSVVKGMTNLGAKVGHDIGVVATQLLPGEQGLENDDFHTYSEFIAPMLGIGQESQLIEDWKYRYGLDELFKGDIEGAVGKLGRGLYEQPFGIVNDALMLGGAVGEFAKVAGRYGEASYLAEKLGADAVKVSQKMAADAAETIAKTGKEVPLKYISEEQAAILRANPRPDWLTALHHIANVEPGEVLGHLDPIPFKRAIGTGEKDFIKRMPVNPVSRWMRKAIYDSRAYSRSFDELNNELKGLAGGNGYDEILSLFEGGQFGNGTPNAVLAEKLGEISGSIDKAAYLFRKMHRMVEEAANKPGIKREYIRTFRSWPDKLYESRMFNNLRSSASARAIERRKSFINVLEKHTKNLYEGIDAWAGRKVPIEDANKLVLSIMQGTAPAEGLQMLMADIAKLPDARALPPLPAEWMRMEQLPDPEGMGLPRYDYNTLIQPIRQFMHESSTVKRSLLEKIGRTDSTVNQITLELPSGPREVISVVVPSMEDIGPTAQKIANATKSQIVGVFETLWDNTNPDKRLVRTVVVGMRDGTGQYFEIAPGTPDMLMAARSTGSVYRKIRQFQDKISEYYGDMSDPSSGILAKKSWFVYDAENSLELAKREANPNAGKVAALEQRLRDAKAEWNRTVEEVQFLSDEVEAAREFAYRLNEGVDEAFKYGEDYNPIRKYIHRVDNAWYNMIIEPEVGAVEGHAASMNFSTMMKRAYGPQRLNKVYALFGEISNNLYDFLEGNFVKRIVNMTKEQRLAFVNKSNFLPDVARAILSGDEAALNKVFVHGIAPVENFRETLAAQVTAFLNLYKFPSQAIEELVRNLFNGIKKDEAFLKPGQAKVFEAMQDMKIGGDLRAPTDKVVSPFSQSASLRGQPLWSSYGIPNYSVLAQMFREYAYQKLGPLFENGEVQGYRWNDLHREWKYVKGQPTPIYYPHILPPNAGSRALSIANRLEQLHPRDTWLKRWDGELLKRGMYDKNFVEAFADKAVALIKHQEIHDLFKEAKKFSRTVSLRELDLWDMKVFKGERLWNPSLVDAAFRLSRQANETLFSLTNKGLDLDAATEQMLKEIMPDAAMAAMQNTTSELLAMPRHIADIIERANRASLPWQMRFLWDSPTQVWRTSVLAFSPRWIINNLFGNTYFQLLKNPKGLMETVRMVLDPEYRAMWEHLTGGRFVEGVDRGLFFEQSNVVNARKYGYAEAAAPDFVEKLTKAMDTKPVRTLSAKAEWMRELQGIIEDSFRRGTFAAEYKSAFRQQMMNHGKGWLKDYDLLERIMKDGPDAQGALVDRALKQVNKTLGDYTNLNHIERTYIRRFAFPFYAFYKHSIKYTLSLPFEHPFKATILRNIEAIDREYEGDQLPDFMRGAFMIGHLSNGDPLWMRTKNWNPLEGVNFGPTGWIANLHPFFRGAFEQAMGISTFSGEKFTSEDTFTTPTGHTYKYLRDEQGNVTGVRALRPDEQVKPTFIDTFMSMWPQYKLLRDTITPGQEYSTGGVIMEGGKPKYPTMWGQAWAGYMGFPTTTFDLNDYLYRQYKDYWRTAVPMAQNRVDKQLGRGDYGAT